MYHRFNRDSQPTGYELTMAIMSEQPNISPGQLHTLLVEDAVPLGGTSILRKRLTNFEKGKSTLLFLYEQG